MAYSHKHRFQRRYGIHYTLKMNVAMVSETSGIPVEILQPIYDEVFEPTRSESKAMLAVYSYCNEGKVFKEKHSCEKAK